MKKVYLLSLGLIFISEILIAQFHVGSLVVSRVGDGSTVLSNNAAQVQLVEYSTSGAASGTVVTLPTAVSGANKICTNSGTATTEGGLSLSDDGRYLTIAGYNAAPGVANVATSGANYDRVIARVDEAGTVNTTTSFLATNTNAYYQASIRNVVSTDGSEFWASGDATGTTGPVRYITLGQTGVPGTIISTTVNNTRGIGIYDNQLYVSSAAGSIRVAKVGSGLPTTPGQTITNLNGLPVAGLSANNFILFDASVAVAGPDLLYVACQSATVGNFGLFKYSFDGITWTSRGSIQTNAQLPGITGYQNCSGGLDLFVTRASSGIVLATEIRSFTDATAYNSNITGNGLDFLTVSTLLVTAGANYGYRAISMAPGPGGYVTGPQSFPANDYNNIIVKSGGVATLTAAVKSVKCIIENGGILNINGFKVGSSGFVNGGFFYLQDSGKIVITGSAGITSSGLTGDVQICTRFFSPLGKYEYGGSVAQVTGTGLPSSVKNLILNTTGYQTVSLTNNINIDDTLSLQNGFLATTSSVLATLRDTTAISSPNSKYFTYGGISNIGWEKSFVRGPMKIEVSSTLDKWIPIGKTDSLFAPVKLKPANAAAKIYSAEYFPAQHFDAYNVDNPPIDHVSFKEYWSIKSTVYPADAYLTLTWRPYSKVGSYNPGGDSANAMNDLLISHYYNPGAGTKWSREGTPPTYTKPASVSLAYGLITTNAYLGNYTSPDTSYTLGSLSPYNSLPLKLLDFSATAFSNTVAIKWITKEEKQVSFYEVEQSCTGSNFSLLGTLASVNSFAEHSYRLTDNKPCPGWNYYRLKITEASGKITYSPVARVWMGSTQYLLVYPNPAQKEIQIILPGPRSISTIAIVNSAGQVVKQLTTNQTALSVDIETLSRGFYFVKAFSNGQVIVQRFTKQ